MAEKRAKHEVQQMLRYLKDGTPMSPRTSPRSPDLSRSNELLREKYDELNRLMLSQIVQRKTLGQLYSSYDLEFKKARSESYKSTRREKQKQKLKASAKQLTEIIDRDRGIRLKVWEMPSDSEEELENESNDEDEIDNIYTDDANEKTCDSTVTIHEVNSDGDEIQSDDDNVPTSTTSTKRVSFVDNKEFKSDPIPCYDANSLETLILRDILRNERKTPKHTDSGLSFQAKPVKRFKYKYKKGTPRQKKSFKKDTSPPEKSPRQKIKSALDNHLDSSSNVDVKQWIREKNKIARKKLKEERKKERIQMEKEQNEANKKAIRLVESEEKVTQWMKDKHKQALIQRKLRQRVEEIQRRNAAMKKTDESKLNNQIKEQFEIRKSTIRRRQRRINKHKAEVEDAVVTKKAEEIVYTPVDPATARLVHDEKLQARAAKKKYGVSVRETLRSAAKQMNRENNTELEDTNNSNDSKLRTPNSNSNKTEDKKQMKKKGRKHSSHESNGARENNNNETEKIGPTEQARKTNRMTYNAWIKIKREGDNNKKLENESVTKLDPDLEYLLPTLSKQRIKRATESKKVTDTGSSKPQTTTKTRPSSGKLSYQGVLDSTNETLRRPTSAMNRRDAGKSAQKLANVVTKSGVSRQYWQNDKSNVLLEGERPEPQGCELPDYSFCQGPTQTVPAPNNKFMDDVNIKKRPANEENGIDVLNTDGIFITA